MDESTAITVPGVGSAGGLGRLLAGGDPVGVERFQLLDRDAAVVLAGIPALEEGLVALAQGTLGQEPAAELLEDLEAGVGRRAGWGGLRLLGGRGCDGGGLVGGLLGLLLD